MMKTNTEWFVYTNGGDLRAVKIVDSTKSLDDYSLPIDNVRVYGGSVDGVNYGYFVGKETKHVITIKDIGKFYNLPDKFDIKVNKKSVKVMLRNKLIEA